MRLSDTEKDILEALVNEGGYLTAKDMSLTLNVSTKTIYRGIKNLREKIDNQIIISDRSKGYKLDYEKYLKTLNEQYTFNNQYMTIESRRILILFKLLTNSPNPINIIDLSIDYFVSESSILNDLEFVNNNLLGKNLKLIRSSNCVHIEGTEDNVRKELMRIVNNFLIDTDTPSLSALTSRDNSTYYLATHFNKNDVSDVTAILKDAMIKMDSTIENPYYTNLLTHLLILLKRQNTSQTSEVKYDINKTNQIKYETAQYIISRMEEVFKIKVSPHEINYVYAFLVSSRNDISKEELDKLEITTNDCSNDFVDDLIHGMEESLNIKFSADSTLRKSLLQHIQPMLNRLEYNVIIINPLIDDIKSEFSNVFYKLKAIINKLQTKHFSRNLSEDEIGYLAIYFQNTLEKIGKQLDVLIVCTTGIGTSHLLKTRVTNHFPILNIKGVISFNELEKYNDMGIDLILTTVNLPSTDAPQLVINALLDKGDVNIINQFIKNKYGSLI